MPAFGLGTWRSGKGQVAAAVEAAVRTGYRHIDAAFVYSNQEEVAAGIQAAAGVCSRQDIFITGKLWNVSHSRADVLRECQLSLRQLNTNYLDLYLIHWPVAMQANADGTMAKTGG